jgi:CheY-like chemotaxis protein/anti-sigma regulatory factor (Ser/Thr protein kinase)
LLRLPPERAAVLGDKTRLVQALANLLNNAAKYTPQHGRIELVLAADGTRFAVSVRDNGSGIAPALMPYVFDLFTQGERTPDRAHGGLGLGLALVKSIAALHGGEVRVDSEGPGHGSTFTMLLPMGEPGAASPAPAAPEMAVDGGHTVRLMIVDDNQDAAHSLAVLLKARGHAVLVAEDAREALDAAASAEIDAFVLDIGLPDMDGYELARRLRAQDRHKDALLIALTGYGQAHDRVLSKEAGFDHHFVKPVDVEKLAQMLATRR